MKDNLELEKRLTGKAMAAGIPLNACFELLPLCNMNCRMCFIRLSRDEADQMGGLRTVEEWLSIGEQLRSLGTMFILLTGGEPFLYKDFKKLYSGLRSMGMVIRINTNGTLIDEEMADFLAADRPRRLNITLYGASDETYAKICGNPKGFSQTVRAVRLLRERGVDVRLNGTIVPENVHEIEMLGQVAKDLGVEIGIATYLFPATRERKDRYDLSSRLDPEQAADACIRAYRTEKSEEYPEMVREALEVWRCNKKRSGECLPEPMMCQGGRSSAWISWQGRMQPCVFMNHISRDVLGQNVRNAWDFIREETEKIRLPIECANCDKRGNCDVCAAACYWETGSTGGKPEYLCRYTEAQLKMMEDWMERT